MRHAIVHSCALTLAALSTTPLAADVIHVDLNAFESGSSVSTLNNQTAGGGQWWNPSNGSVSARYQSGLGRTGGTALVIGNNGSGNNGVVNNCATGRLIDAAGESTVAPNRYFEASYWFRTASSTYVDDFNFKSEAWGTDRTTWIRFESNADDNSMLASAWGIGDLGDGVNDTGGYFTADGGFDQSGSNLLRLDFGSWYRVGVTVTFVDGAPGLTNDIVTHTISDSTGALLGSLTCTSWEVGARLDGYNGGEIFGIDKLGFDSRGWGGYTGDHAYVDGISYGSFAVPAPGAAALLGLVGLVTGRRRHN